MQRYQSNHRHVRLGLMGAASLGAMMFAGQAQAQCVANPSQPLNAITTDSTVVFCTGVVSGPVITANANGVLIEANGSGTNVTGANIDVIGNSNAVIIRNNAVLNGSLIDMTGTGNTLMWTFGAITNNLIVNVTGANSQLIIDNATQVTQSPGDTTISAPAGQANTVLINATGGLFATGSNGSYLVNGGTGNQSVTILGFMAVQGDGLALSLGDGDDLIQIGGTANISGGTGNNILFNGGAGQDTLSLNYAGAWDINTSGIETINVNPGAALALGGTNADATQINLQSGAVTVTSGAPLGLATSTIDIGGFAGLTLAYGASASFDHTLTGTGGLTVNAAGHTLTFGGNGSGYDGLVTLGAGTTAAIANATALGTGAIVNNGTLSFADLNLANAISGTGQVVYTGAGTGDLSGANTFAGGLDIRSGSLRIDSVSALGTGAVTSSVGGAVLQADNAADQTLANNLTGALVLVKTDGGVLTLTGTNTYTGGTLIDSGAIRVDSFARLGTGQVITNPNGSLVLDYSGAGQLLQSTPFMTGSGRFIKEGTGDVVMNQSSTYTGGTTIRAGRIGLNNGGALGTGSIQIDSGAVLGIGGVTLDNTVTGSGSIVKTANNGANLNGDNSGFAGVLDLQDGWIIADSGEALGSGTVTIGLGTYVSVDSGGTDTVIAASLAGAGDLELASANRFTLTGSNGGLTGVIAVNSGTLAIAGSQNVGSSAQIDLTGASSVLELSTAGSSTLSNAVTGLGGVVKTGTGTVAMTGANTYSGGTDIQQGAIRVTDTVLLGTGPITVQQGAALDLSIAGQQTLNQAISGAGILRKSDQGDLTLLGNGLTGGVDIVGGRVIVNTAAALGGGAVSMAADTQLVFDNAVDEVMATPISGAGGLTKEGTGKLVIANANTYTGGTLINEGRLGLNNGQGLGSGDVIVLQDAILGIGGVTLANNVSGAGQVIKTANNTAVLTGTNTFSGGLDIQEGNVSVSSSAALGTGTVSIAAGAALTYTASGATTFSNALSGAGTFDKVGAGQLTFAGNFAIGALNLAAGRTRINTVATTAATVGAAATLDGTGRIVGTLTNNGTVAPGNSIGTLTVQGNYVQNAGSVLEIEFDASGGIDLLEVTGTATLNGGTLRFVSLGGAEGSGGTFLTAAGGVTGTFAAVETVGAQLPLAVIYQPNAGIMAPSVLTARPSTFNAQSLAAADTALGFIDSIGVGEVRHGQGSRVWMQGFGAWARRSAAGTTLGYDHDTHGISGGINLAAGDAVTLGAAIGWAKGEIALGSNGGGGEQSSVLGSLTLRYAAGGATLGAGVLYGKVDQDTVRNVSFSGFAASVAGSTDSTVFGTFAELGLPLGSTGGWAFSANARGSYVRQTQDAYTESGTSPLRLSVGEVTTETIEGQAKLTAKTSLWDRSNGGEETPEGLDLRIDLGARYLGALGDRAIPVTFAASSAGVVLRGDTRDTLQGTAGLALDYTTRGGATFSLGYRGELGQTDRHAVHAGLSFAF